MTEKTSGVYVEPASRGQAPILGHLLELYAHDFSEFHPLEIGPDGRFGYKPLPLYWSESGRHPFLIRFDGKIAGLALVKKGSAISDSQEVWDMAEFFVLRGYRRLGIGTVAAQEVWRRFPGLWEVRVMQSNASAIIFWQRVISDFVGTPTQPGSIELEGKSWLLFSFAGQPQTSA